MLVTATGWPKGAYVALGVSGAGASSPGPLARRITFAVLAVRSSEPCARAGGEPLAAGSNGTFSGLSAGTNNTCASQIFQATIASPGTPATTVAGPSLAAASVVRAELWWKRAAMQ